MTFIKKALFMFGFAVLIAAPILTFATPQDSFAKVTKGKDCERSILGIPTWFRGLAVVKNGQCSIAGPGQKLDSGKSLDLAGYIWRIALNIVSIGLAIVAYIAFFFIMFGGFKFLTGGNNPSQIEAARKTILNAVIGLVISLGAVAIVNLVFGIVG